MEDWTEAPRRSERNAGGTVFSRSGSVSGSVSKSLSASSAGSE
jgi:hypothetical protein